MFVEMLNTTENDDVKRFYINNVMNHEEIPKTIKEIMKKLKLQFGKTERQKWDEAFQRISSFKWNDKSPKEVWELLEVDRFKVKEVWKTSNGDVAGDESIYLLKKMMIRNYIRIGIEEKLFDKAIIPKIEEEVEKVNYDMDRIRKILK